MPNGRVKSSAYEDPGEPIESGMSEVQKEIGLSSVTTDQYELGYQLFMGLPPGPKKLKAIMETAKLTATQVKKLTTKGYRYGKPEPWPSWNDRLSAEVLALQQNACVTARNLSSHGVKLFERAIRNTERAQMVVSSILDIVNHRLRQADIQADGESLEKIMPGPAMRGTLAVLRPYSDMSHLGRAFQDIYGSPHGRKNQDAPDEMYVDLSGDYSLRGGFAFAGSIDESVNQGDVLEELMPEIAGWTEDELDAFAETGAHPTRSESKKESSSDSSV